MSLCSPARVLFALILVATFATPLRGDPLNPCELGGSERPDEGAIGGTGARLGSDEGAIGGTGARPDEGGVGGTGRTDPTRVGVIGTVTGFASICIGRVEVHYTSQEGVQRLGGLCKPAPLKRPSMLAINQTELLASQFFERREEFHPASRRSCLVVALRAAKSAAESRWPLGVST